MYLCVECTYPSFIWYFIGKGEEKKLTNFTRKMDDKYFRLLANLGNKIADYDTDKRVSVAGGNQQVL